MVDVTIGSVPAREAINNIRQKLRIPTARWDSLLGDVHAKAFTIAGATKMDLLSDFHESLSSLAESGGTLADFRNDFDHFVAKHGWEYRGSRGWRTSVIFNTNMRSAHMAGRWKQIQRTKAQRPYLVYMTVGDTLVRPEHANWNKTALPVDDPWWDTHYPPNGWGCRCYTNTANKRQLERQGLEVSDAPEINLTPRVNTRTGEEYPATPEGIDTGWDYNVGKAWLGPDVAFGEKLMNLPPVIRKEVLENNQDHIRELSKSWKQWLKDRSGQTPKGYAHTVGYLPNTVIEKLIEKGVQPAGAAVIVYDRQTTHLLGEHKGSHKRIPVEWLNNLPDELLDYQAVLIHRNDLVFVLKETSGGRNARAVIQVNFKRKGQTFNTVRSLGVLDVKHLRGSEYEVIDGKL